MWLVTRFNTDSGAATGLSPIVKVRDLETDALTVSGSMSELGDGFYAYNFTGYDITKEYAILYDAVTLPSSFRYMINTLDTLTDNMDVRTALLRKISTNKLLLRDGKRNNWRLYDDDNTTQLLKWNVSDKLGNPIDQVIRDVSGRSKGT